jgi:ubiquinol-cytochrome c reductase cytochrome c1 subunit
MALAAVRAGFARRPLAGSTAFGGAALATGLVLASPSPTVLKCDDKDPPHPPRYPFWFKSIFHAMDIPSVRRGYEVYRQVCATCHSMKQLHFRHLVNQVYPEKHMKGLAALTDVTDGPNDEGEMYQRPGILTDAFPSPYPNEEAARYANGGALPPDLSVYTTAKHEGVDYIFALLLGYRDPPVGIAVRDGLYYNTYFPGGLIGMPPPLHSDGLVEYEDGTPCTRSQMAKDVVVFLTWASEPTHDERKVMGLKSMSACMVGTFFIVVWYRTSWIGFKTRRIDFAKAVM